MSPPVDTAPALADARATLVQAIDRAAGGMVGRRALCELIVLAATAGEHMLVVGPPGTGKSEAVRRVGQALGGSTFEYLLGRFTEPAELFGPVDLRRLREGVLEVDTSGMLPEADFVFLDELFLGSTAVLNTLLGVLAEGRYRRGRTDVAVPLRACIAACNHLPEDPALAALSDRFLVRCFVDPLPDAALESLLSAGHRTPLDAPPSGPALAQGTGLAALDRLRAAAQVVALDPARPALAAAIRRLRSAGIVLSDRRLVRSQRLVAAAAALAGRTAATAADIWPLLFLVPTSWGQDQARAVLPSLVAEADNALLSHAVTQVSTGASARATQLVAEARPLLAAADPDIDRLHGWLRDADVAFDAADRPAALEEARAAIVALLSPGSPATPSPHG